MIIRWRAKLMSICVPPSVKLLLTILWKFLWKISHSVTTHSVMNLKGTYSIFTYSRLLHLLCWLGSHFSRVSCLSRFAPNDPVFSDRCGHLDLTKSTRGPSFLARWPCQTGTLGFTFDSSLYLGNIDSDWTPAEQQALYIWWETCWTESELSFRAQSEEQRRNMNNYYHGICIPTKWTTSAFSNHYLKSRFVYIIFM